MFSEPKLGLLKLEILTGVGEERSEVKNILNCVAKGTEALCHLNLTIGELVDGLFDKLVARNQSLEEFVCYAIQYEDNGKCDVAEMAEGILQLPKLKSCRIQLHCLGAVKDKTRK